MKKTFAIVMALVMVFALMVPAFAIDQKSDPASGDTIIKTKTTKDDGNGGEESVESFTVTIPADTEIEWGATSTELGYTVEAHLAYGKTLSVSVAGNDVMTYAASDADTFELEYALGGTTEFDSDYPVVYPQADQTFTVDITEDAWNYAVVGVYQDTLTFTVEVNQ